MDILERFFHNQEIQKWHRNFHQKTRQLVLGLSGSAKVLAMATAVSEGHKVVLLTANQAEAERLASDFIEVLGEKKVYTFIADDTPLAEFVFSSKEKIYTRLEALKFLLDQEQSGIVLTNLSGSRLLLPDPKNFTEAYLKLQIGIEVELYNLVNQLVKMGYEKVSRVVKQGEFSLRGDILDLFDIASELPVRLEFFGDEIDSMRTFDVESQTSLETLSQIQVSPANDIYLTSDDFCRLKNHLETVLATTEDAVLRSYLSELLSATKQENLHADSRKFLSYAYEKQWTLLNYLPPSTLLFFDDFQKILDKHASFELEVAEMLTQDLQKSQALPNLTYFASNYLDYRNYRPATFFSSFQKGLGNLKFDAICQFSQHPMQEFFSQLPMLIDEVHRFEKTGYQVIIQTSSESSLHSLQKSLQEYDFELLTEDVGDSSIMGYVGNLSQGFQFVDEKLVLITEKEIFQKKIRRRMRRQNISNAERIKDYNELEKGDYVVHNIHGIGQYLGIETLEISGIHRDYLTIQYQHSDRISIPVDQIHLLSKYVASDGKIPKINTLNDGRFKKAKQKVAKQVEDIADDLLKLYAERSMLKGFAFSPDDQEQEEFDNDFPYVETEDQLRSIVEIKQDMEKDTPMDRLLVGDVGFGKTEVAMRAAFKAVKDHKQVAVLVPTTVLAQQHFVNFQERFADFAINVDVLSRFRTKVEQTKTLDNLKKGRVDIIIGTHRLLSKDVEFADLGLIIIDEEQRFGVRHKEKLKELKMRVDVLTLTATPIPRTLHMSMLGIRDLSVIETPPTNRYPVQTYVLETNPTVIKEAIIREIDRGGQVYYLYNKVDTIEQKVAELQEMIPEASIGFVHGQMSEIRLENTLMDFVNGVYDVLVTTTIIETGVDIPNANTLFIENADYMGLSTLYQLRGRVGRSSRIAYAYFMYRPDKTLTEVSEQRLEAIKGFTELGSGFKIAMRDLSIRGSGNILGSSQSGFIDSVGFELYSQLLEEAILKKQGKEQLRNQSNAELNLQIDAYLPSDYIDDERQKIEIYKRIRELTGQSDYEELQAELMDRFGEYPDAVAYLLEIGLVKSYLNKIFVSLVERRADTVTVRFEKISQQFFLTQDYFEGLSVTDLKARIGENKGMMEIIFDVRNKKDFEILEGLSQFGQKMFAIKQRKTENI